MDTLYLCRRNSRITARDNLLFHETQLSSGDLRDINTRPNPCESESLRSVADAGDPQAHPVCRLMVSAIKPVRAYAAHVPREELHATACKTSLPLLPVVFHV